MLCARFPPQCFTAKCIVVAPYNSSNKRPFAPRFKNGHFAEDKRPETRRAGAFGNCNTLSGNLARSIFLKSVFKSRLGQTTFSQCHASSAAGHRTDCDTRQRSLRACACKVASSADAQAMRNVVRRQMEGCK